MIARVQQNHPQLFLVKGTHLIENELRGLFGALDSLLLNGFLLHSVTEFKSRFDLGSLGGVDSVLVAYFVEGCFVQTNYAIEGVQQPLGNLNRVLTSDTYPEQNP